MSDNDIDDLLDIFHKTMIISHQIEYEQYYAIAVQWMKKTDQEADALTKDLLRDNEVAASNLYNHLKDEQSIAIAVRKYKLELELFLIHIKKILGYRSAVSDKREQLKIFANLLLNIIE